MNRGIRAWNRLKEDVYNLRFAFLGIFLYYAAVHVLFGLFCPVRIVVHMPCPGCGMTRAFFLALTGRWTEAWEMHPMIYGWMLFGALFLFERYFMEKKGMPFRAFLVLLCLGTLFVYAYRLVYGFPKMLV